MKSFHEQFRECSEEGMHGAGELEKWKDHPENLPFAWSRAAKLIEEELKVNPNAGLRTIACLRFGGVCKSDHPECKKLRTVA